MAYLNELLIPFNVKINHISKTTVNPKADIKTYDNLVIEFINQYENPEEIKQSLQKELNFLTNELSRSKSILANTNFISKAPKQKVDLEKKKLLEYEQRYNEIKKVLDKY
jgi:valyl-tRNA synthetase